MTEILDMRRLWLLIRGDLISDYRTLGITAAALAALMLLSSMYTVSQFGESDSYYAFWYFAMLFVWGAILASFSFRELHDKTKNEAYLLLPASPLEKMLARLLRATVGFFVFLLIFLTVTSAIIESANWLLFGRRNGLFDPSLGVVWWPVGHFIVCVSLYFLGAAWFRKLHFVKTALTLMAIPIVLSIFAGFILNIVFGPEDFRQLGADSEQLGVDWERGLYNYYLAHQGLFDALLGLGRITYFFALPAFCWFVAWLRVKETQVSHGV